MSSFQEDPVRNLPLVNPPYPGEKRASGWQIAATAIGAIVVVTLFLWGINNQRDETAGQQTAVTQAAPSGSGNQQGGQPPQAQNQQQDAGNAPTTTGQGGDQASQSSNTGQNSNPQPSNAIPNATSNEDTRQPAPPRGR